MATKRRGRIKDNRTKITDREREEIHFLRKQGLPLRALEERYGIHNTTISEMVRTREKRGVKPKIKVRVPKEFKDRDYDLQAVGIIKTNRGWRTIYGGLS